MVRFLAEGELAGLVKLLRSLGYDCAYDGGASTVHAITRATAGDRVLLTLKPVAATAKLRVLRIPTGDPDSQLAALAPHLKREPAAPFSRCLKCNAVLEPLPPQQAAGFSDQIPESVLRRGLELHCCPACLKVYWQGSHVARMARRLQAAGFTGLTRFTDPTDD